MGSRMGKEEVVATTALVNRRTRRSRIGLELSTVKCFRKSSRAFRESPSLSGEGKMGDCASQERKRERDGGRQERREVKGGRTWHLTSDNYRR